jgi:hypothetical protein
MNDVSQFVRGTPISLIPPINDSKVTEGPHGLARVMGFHVPFMQSVAVEHDIALAWPCAVVGYACENGVLFGLLHNFDHEGGEVMLRSCGVPLSRRLLRDAAAVCDDLEAGGIFELRIRLSRSAHKLRCRARRYDFAWFERSGDDDVFSIRTRDFCRLGRGVSLRSALRSPALAAR